MLLSPFAGRTVRVSVAVRTRFSALLRMAVEVGFDWVIYESHDYVRLSVIPDGEPQALFLLPLLSAINSSIHSQKGGGF